MAKSVESYDAESSRKYAEQALKLGIGPINAIEEGLWRGMKTVGDKFDDGDIFLPEVLLAVETMNSAVKVLVASMGSDAPMRGSVVIGTAEGDIHTLGKDIVAAMLSASGFKVFDLGADVKAERFLEKAKEVGAKIIACSALMSTTMPRQREVVEAVGEENLKIDVMVGGGAITRQWAEDIHAHYADSASNAVKLAIELAGSMQGGVNG